MARDLFPEINEDKPANGARGSSQQILLLVLLFLILVFGYLYFFTNLIRQREEVAKTPPAQTTQIRQPLPPRPNQEGEKPAAVVKPEEKQPAQAKAEKPAPPPAPPQQAKPVPPQAKPVPSQARPAAVPPQPAPGKAVKAEDKTLHKELTKASPAPAPAVPRKKAGAKPVVAATSTGKKAPVQAAAPQAVKPAAEQGAYALLADFAADKEMKAARAKLTKLGITPVHAKKVEKLQTMHRLFLADFDTHYAADMELQKLQKVSSSTFILEENGRYAVYAGSYLHEKGAAAERKRLAGKGFNLSVKTAKVKIPVHSLTAGAFASSEDARKEASVLKKKGITARVIKTGK